MTRYLTLMTCVTAVLVLTPSESLACPTCSFGDPDSPVVQGTSWMVVTLLGVTGGVFSGFVGFFFYLMKRSRQTLGHESELSDGYHGGSAV